MNEKLNIQNLIDLLAEKHGMSKKYAESFVKEFFQLIEECLEKDKYVKIKGLGAFKLIDVESRESINVNTGERIEINGHTKVSFNPEPALKEIINRPFSHFETVPLNDAAMLEDIFAADAAEEEEGTEESATEAESAAPVENVAMKEVEISEEVINRKEEQSPNVPSCAQEDFERDKNIEETSEKTDVIEESGVSWSMRCFIGIVAMVLMLCIGAVVCLYYPGLFRNTPTPKPSDYVVMKKNNDTTTLNNDTVVVGGAILADTIVTIKADSAPQKNIAEVGKPASVDISPMATASPSVIKVKEQSAAKYVPDSTGYAIVGTKTMHIVKSGETLTKISLHFYGTKALYPYIVLHNKEIIKKPDNVPVGTKIKIPKLAKKR